MSEMDVPLDFGPRIRAVMALHDLYHHDLARTLGVTRKTVSMICQGKREPSKPVVLLLGHRFGEQTAKYLLGQSDVLPSVFSQRCIRPCSECEGLHHATLGDEKCKHCAAIIPLEDRV